MTRIALALLCAISTLVGVKSVREATQQDWVTGVATRSLRGDVSGNDTVLRRHVGADLKPSCAVEHAIGGVIVELNRTGRDLGDLWSGNRDALRCEPTLSFGWLLRFWMTTNPEAGISAPDWESLRMSYATGPNEGWIAARRGPIAAANYGIAPDAIRRAATHDFVNLVKFGFISDALDMYHALPSDGRMRFQDELKTLAQSQPSSFSKIVDQFSPLKPSIDDTGDKGLTGG